MLQILRSVNRRQGGFTLIEILVALSITGFIGAGLTTAIVQVMKVNALGNNQVIAVKQVENAVYWINRDVRMSQTIQPGGGSGFPLNLDWVEWGGTTHQVAYTLQNGELIRSSSVNATPPVVMKVAQHISSNADNTSCQYSNGVFNFKVTASVSGFRPASETRLAQVIPRSAQ